jgi:hypothetical protein
VCQQESLTRPHAKLVEVMTVPDRAAIRPPDDEMLHAARQLESENPLWIVIFGVYTRQFVAFPRFSAPGGTMAVAHCKEALTAKMRDIERKRPGSTIR